MTMRAPPARLTNLALLAALLLAFATGVAVVAAGSPRGRLLLATRVGGAPLEPRHGFPARLVAPGRRGFWW
jgi:DMSO/TMAO reductase YedYZ molybdopterin-dependent catalytic subunit